MVSNRSTISFPVNMELRVGNRYSRQPQKQMYTGNTGSATCIGLGQWSLILQL
jgi:hypothetical protein